MLTSLLCNFFIVVKMTYFHTSLLHLQRPHFDYCPKSMASLGVNREFRGQLANPGSPGKTAVKMVCAYAGLIIVEAVEISHLFA